MPIYEYRCEECGTVSELMVGVGRNSDELQCKSCNGSKLEKIMSASSISVKNPTQSMPAGSTCCGSNPSQTGCVPGSCCGAT